MEKLRIFHFPTAVLAGRGAIGAVGETLRGLGVSGKALVFAKALVREEKGLVGDIVDSLHRAGFSVRVKEGPEVATTVAVEREVSVLSDVFDIMVVVGPEETIHFVKAFAAVFSQGGLAWDYAEGRRRIVGKVISLVTVPTRPGSGAETSKYAEISNPFEGKRAYIESDALFPMAAVLDTDAISFITPLDIIVACMKISLTCLDTLLSKYTDPLSESLAHLSIKLIAKNAVKLANDPFDFDAREAMLYASAISGAAISQTGYGLLKAVSLAFESALGISPEISPLFVHHSLEILIGDDRTILEKLSRAVGEKIPSLSWFPLSFSELIAKSEIYNQIGDVIRRSAIRAPDPGQIAERVLRYPCSGNTRIKVTKRKVKEAIENSLAAWGLLP